LSGRQKDAKEALNSAVSIRKQLTAEFPLRVEFRQKLADCHHFLGVLYQAAEELPVAETAYNAALAIRKQLAAEFPGRREFLHEVAGTHNNLGLLYSAMGRRQDAVTAFSAALTIRRQMAAAFASKPDYQNDLAGILVNLASLLNSQREFAQARRLLEEAQSHHDAALHAAPKHPVYQQFYRTHMLTLVQTCAGQGDQAAALAAAAKFRDLGWDPPTDAYFAAEALALCVDVVAKDDKSSVEQRDKQAKFYGDEAMTMLRGAIAKGYKNAAGMKRDTHLNSLRQREDFQKLLSELEK
jgi:tetratricopeptide (TPR) repeat protein